MFVGDLWSKYYNVLLVPFKGVNMGFKMLGITLILTIVWISKQKAYT